MHISAWPIDVLSMSAFDSILERGQIDPRKRKQGSYSPDRGSLACLMVGQINLKWTCSGQAEKSHDRHATLGSIRRVDVTCRL